MSEDNDAEISYPRIASEENLLDRDHDVHILKIRSSIRSFIRQDDEVPVKILGPDNEEIFPEDIILPPDGGWGWMVVFSAFMSNLISGGTAFSFGTLIIPILNSTTTENPATETGVAWVGGIQSGFYLMFGPFVSSLCNAFGFRVTAIVGSIITFVAYTVTWGLNMDGDKEGPNMDIMFIFYAFIGGVGFCLIYAPTVIVVGHYFEKRRALATGISICGTGIGTFIYAPLSAYLIDEIQWPKTILVEGILVLACAGFALLYRPLRPPEDTEGNTNRNNIQEGVTVTVTSVGSFLPLQSKQNLGPIIIDDNISQGKRSKSESGRSTPKIGMSTSMAVILVVPPSEANHMDSRVFRVASSTTSLNKPLHKKDIFYEGRLENIPELSESRDNVAHHVELEASPVEATIDPGADQAQNTAGGISKKSGLFKKCCSMTVLKKILDFSMLKSITFFIFSLAGMTTFLAFFVPFTYLKKYALDSGCTKSEATTVIATIGVSNTLGRVICGFMADKLITHVLLMSNVALSVGGLTTLLIPFINTLPKGVSVFPFLVAYAFLFGLSVACFMSLRTIILVELMGLSKLTNGVGLMLLFHGIGALFGTPLAGRLRQKSGNYDLSFHVAGSLMLISGIMCYPLNSISRWEKKLHEEKELNRLTT